MKFRIEVLPAYYGDSILLSYKATDNSIRNMLIDGGIGRAYPHCIKNKLKRIVSDDQSIDLLIITHIDDDHIGGIIKLFEDKGLDKKIIKRVWFNSEHNIASSFNDLKIKPDYIYLNNGGLETSLRQGIKLEGELEKLSCWEKRIIQFDDYFRKYEIDGLKITVLSPNFDSIVSLNRLWEREKEKNKHTASKNSDYSQSIENLAKKVFVEDNSITNKSSIALLLEYNSKSYMLLGDAHPSDIVSSLRKLGYCEEERLNLEYIKLSHHGSKSNINDELLNLIECENFIVSTNGERHGLPNKETFARIVQLKKDVKIYFNYNIYKKIFTDDEINKYEFKLYNQSIFEV